MCHSLYERNGEFHFMITAAQLRAARALLGIDQRELAEMANLSVPTIQRMESSDGVIRGNVDSLTKLVAALEDAGIELINDGAMSPVGGRGVRLKEHVGRPKAYRSRGARQAAGSTA
jgi:transcriptional regulator with XRE-family HTH domain